MTVKILACLKLMPRLDITERGVPQDGRTKMQVFPPSKNRANDFRASACPTLFGKTRVLISVIECNRPRKIPADKNCPGVTEAVAPWRQKTTHLCQIAHWTEGKTL